MKTKLLIFLLLCAPVFADFQITESFLDALEYVETGRGPEAIGDGGNAWGTLQLWKIYVDEANRILKAPVFGYDLRTDPEASREMVRVVLKYWGRYFERKGIRITPWVLCSLHRQPNMKWTPKRMKSDLEKDREIKLMRYLWEQNNAQK